MGTDDDATLVLDSALIEEEDSGDSQTLVQDLDEDERTVVVGGPTPVSPADARAARMHAIERAGMGRAIPQPLPHSGPVARTLPMPPRVAIPTAQDLQADPERRMLPFASSMPPPMGNTAATGNPLPVPRTPPPPAPAPNPRVVAPAAPAAPPEPPAPPAEPPAGNRTDTLVGRQAPSAAALAAVAAVRPPFDSAMVTVPEGTPPVVIRFLAVCGMLTAAGLAALIYLEL